MVRTEPKSGTAYVVDECMYYAKSDAVAVFPIPKLDIHDTVEYNGKKYIVHDIVYNYISKAQMVLGVSEFNELQNSELSVKTMTLAEIEETPVSKPYVPLFAPSETQAGRGETAESLLNQLDYRARAYLEELAQQVQDDMGDDFEPIVITSVYRSKEYQISDILMKKIKLEGDSNMYGYYKDEAPVSAPYLKIIQNLYDGVYDHKIGAETRDLYLADLQEITDDSNRAVFQSIIEEKYNDLEYVINSYEKYDYGAERLLTKSYIDNGLFNPSYHTITDSQGNPASWAIDFRNSVSVDNLAIKHEFENKGKWYTAGEYGEPHTHFTIRVDIINQSLQ